MNCRSFSLVLLCSLAWLVSGAAGAEATYPPGLIVLSVEEGRPAAQAGVQVGDVLLACDGVPLVFVSSLEQAWERAWAVREAMAGAGVGRSWRLCRRQGRGRWRS